MTHLIRRILQNETPSWAWVR